MALAAMALLQAACAGASISAIVELPTVAETADSSALSEFVATVTAPAPSPVPTLPTSTPLPTLTPSIPPTVTPHVTETSTPNPAAQINGVPFEEIAVISPEVMEHVREIARRGRELGRNPRAFSKLGDSAVLVESNLTRFDNGPLMLGSYDFLQPTIDWFSESWKRYGGEREYP